MKYRYRDHRGSLEESLKTQREFYTKEEMFKDIASHWDGFISAEDLLINDEDNGGRYSYWLEKYTLSMYRTNG